MYVGIDLSKETIICTLLEHPQKLLFFWGNRSEYGRGFSATPAPGGRVYASGTLSVRDGEYGRLWREALFCPASGINCIPGRRRIR